MLRVVAKGTGKAGRQEVILYLPSKNGKPDLEAELPASIWYGYGKRYRSEEGYFDEDDKLLRHEWDVDDDDTAIEWAPHRIPAPGQPLTLNTGNNHGETFHLTIESVREVDAPDPND